MSFRLRTLTLRMRPPGGDWHTVATSLAGDHAVAVGDVTISWGQPTPRDQPEPGAIAFTLLVPDGALDEALLAYDTEIRIEATLNHWTGAWTRWPADEPRILTRGWLTRWTRDTRRRLDGRRTYKITCIDILGRAAATNLAAAPWPANQTMQQRVAAINSASPSGPLVALGSYVTVQPFDVDNAAALDVISRHAGIADVMVESATGITIERRPNQPALYDGGLHFFFGTGLGIIPVQADMIEDLGREMDRSSVVSEIGITAYWGTEPDRREVTYRNASAGYSSSRYSIDTDERIGVGVNGVDQAVRVAAWAQQLIAESLTPRRRLPAGHRLRLGLERVNDNLLNLFLIFQRGRSQILRIEDPPDDLDALQYVQGGTLTVTGLNMHLTITTAPAGLFGVRAMRYADLPRDSRRPRIRGTATTNEGTTYRKTRISDTSVVSIAAWPASYDPT